jgi:hypothetical protein
MLDPIADETGTGDDIKVVIFAVDQIEQSRPVQLLQARKI